MAHSTVVSAPRGRKRSANRGGRPTPEQARQITGRIIASAGELFFSQGFEATTVDQIVATAAISKRTFYTRFVSKEDLFAAFVRHRTDLHLRSLEKLPALPASLEEALTELGCRFFRIALTDEAIAMDRLINSESRKFPQLARAFYDIGVARGCAMVAAVLDAALARGELRIEDTEFLAEQFIHAVVSGPLRKAILGIERPTRQSDLRVHVARLVDLFVGGCCKKAA